MRTRLKTNNQEGNLLFALAAILFAFWVIALAFKVTVGVIHLALVAAVVLLIVGFIRGRVGGPTTPTRV